MTDERPTSVPWTGAVDDELRPVTALFADIVGSTGLGERLAPDEVKEVVGDCVSRMSRVVEEFGGTIQAYVGDGICAYFGLPASHEDDPERAARAALKIMRVIGEYSRDIEAAWGVRDFNVRIGINSGQAGIGMVGAADRQAVALGDSTNVAARLQAGTEPGTIALGAATARRLGPGFDLRPAGTLPVKGREEPVSSFRLIGVASDARRAVELPLLGRDHEMATIEAIATDLRSGRGQIVLFVGDAGIGRTRLLGELRQRVGDVPWLEGECAGYGGQMPYAPFVAALRGWLGVTEGVTDVAVRLRLRARLAPLLADRAAELLPYLARFLGVRSELGDDEALNRLTPDGLAVAMRGAYAHWVAALCARGPVVVALEDAHWADVPTGGLAELLIPLTDRTSLILAITTRRESSSEGWRLRLQALADYSHRTTEIAVGPIADEAAHRLIQVMLPGALDHAAEADLVARAEGNPLYIEELVRTLAEAGGADRRRDWTLSTSSMAMLPPALEGLLVAQLDRLPDDPRRLAQVAAVVGRQFPVRVVEQVLTGDEVRAGLTTLLRADVVREVRRFPELECAFRHGLLHEAVLGTLTPWGRRELHGRIGAAYEAVYAGALEDRLDILAEHYARSDDLARALEYLGRAADRAAAIDATDQAAELRRRADKVAARLGEARVDAGARVSEGAAAPTDRTGD
jgi:class 3 adenylate cyclase